MINSVIIDDEPGNITVLAEMLGQYCPQVNVKATAANAAEGATVIAKQQPDLVFLDIEMPYGNAFGMLDKLQPVTFEVIFITAFNNYAITAFKYAALDYLLKPVNIEELKAAVARAVGRIKEKGINQRIEQLLENIKPGNTEFAKLALPGIGGLHFEPVKNIAYLKAEGNYTEVHITGKRKHLASKNLKEYEDILPGTTFCRVHHSFIVNVNYVKKYAKGRGGHIEMEDGTSIPVSVSKKDDFLDKYMQ